MWIDLYILAPFSITVFIITYTYYIYVVTARVTSNKKSYSIVIVKKGLMRCL